MTWYQSPYILIMIATSLAAVPLVAFAWNRRWIPEAKALALLLAASSIWTLTYAAELAASDLPTKVLMVKFQYLGIATTPTLFLIFAARYTRRDGWLTRRTFALLSVEPMATIVLAFTNDSHRLIWERNVLDTSSAWPLMVNHYGPAGWGNIVYSYALVVCVAFLLFQQVVRTPVHRVGKASVLLLTILVPWVANALYLSEVNPIKPIDLTPIGFTFMVLVLASGVSGLRLSDLLSISRQAVIDHMHDSVVILRTDGRILDLNPMAQSLAGAAGAPHVGRLITEVWPEWPDFGGSATSRSGSMKQEMALSGGARGIFEVQVSPVVDWRGLNVGLVATLRDVTERKRLEAELEGQYQRAVYLADRDSVTGLFNHRAIHDRMERELLLARRTEQPLSFVMLDLDGFKQVNDVYGHPVGDAALRHVASILYTSLRGSDLVGRYGGDEFAAILPGASARGASDLAARIQAALVRKPFLVAEGASFPIGISFGISTYPDDGADIESIVRVADGRLYESKRSDLATGAATRRPT